MKKANPKKALSYDRKNFWKEAPAAEQKAAMDYAIPYKKFLDECKTERETAIWMEKLLKKHKFVSVDSKKGSKRVYRVFRGKTMAVAILGSEPLNQGFNMVASHIDAP
ncbi:MAG: aminopeptidase, partial [Candidatus Cloacimonetes bacterium]|nr:aminopeptidase [Candidatus Cloacimonadota bacterium]MDD4806508.1 aminopeptidase [Candidatus Cloacimonadota bacterium]